MSSITRDGTGRHDDPGNTAPRAARYQRVGVDRAQDGESRRRARRLNDGTYDGTVPHAAPRGRGATINPANRFDRVSLHVLGDHLDREAALNPAGVQVPTTTVEDDTRSIINRVDDPNLNFRWTLNPYRGCEHGCVYCYARPTHENLGYSSGLDFETKIVVKRNAPALLRKAISKPSWQGEPIMMSGVTDPYQPQERELGITRECLEVMADHGQPVSMITKSASITRDIDLLGELASARAARVAISLTTLNTDLARSMEPRASSPADRLRTIERLSDAGIPVVVMIAPVVPALTDHEIPKLLEAAANAGAKSAGWVMLRLPYQVKTIFIDWLRRTRPDRAKRVEAAVRETREGSLYETTFGVRQRRHGARAEQIGAMFRVHSARHGLDRALPPLSWASFERPIDDPQQQLLFTSVRRTRAESGSAA